MNREEIDRIIREDTAWSPESDDYEEISIVNNGKVYKGYKHAMEKGGIVARYYEDTETVRAYALTFYATRVAIIFDKKNKSYFMAVLGEDDGSWFLVNKSWSILHKSTFIACMSEALNLFNANFRDKKQK